MAWNEPGGKKDKDPWGEPGREQGPPDLDEVVRKLQDRLSRLFGGKRGGGSGGGHNATSAGIGAILAVVVVLWGLSGFYTVEQGYRGVEMQFGRYTNTTQAGLQWHLPFPIESVTKVNVEDIRDVAIGYRSGVGGKAERRVPQEALMLTQDENIIDIQFAIQYKVKDAKDYLFNVRDPDATLQQATESGVREVIGKSKMDFALKEGRAEIAVRVEELVQTILDSYGTGLQITSVNMQDAQPPEQVQGAFNDAIKAEQDQDRVKKEAEAYSNDILPRARGEAARRLEGAAAYKEKVIAMADGETSRFLQLLKEYEQAPAVTRERLYLDALEDVLGRASKVMVDVKGGNSLMYLPLDRLMQRQPAGESTAPMIDMPAAQGGVGTDRSSQSSSQRGRTNLRERETR
jgi:membrane protease subunit HflK